LDLKISRCGRFYEGNTNFVPDPINSPETIKLMIRGVEKIFARKILLTIKGMEIGL
jgi:hypothetical protein